jgi:tetratricopeptide (TPR) repeat protein
LYTLGLRHRLDKILILASITFVCCGVPTALGQEAEPDWTALDYFQAQTDHRVGNLLVNVEKNHMIRQHKDRQGALQFDLADLKYTLWVFPNHPRALFLIGEHAKVGNNPGLALPFFEQALFRYPHYAYTRAQYGQFLIDIGANTLGIRELEAALRLDPNLIVARAWLSDATSDSRPADKTPADLAP